MLTCGSNACGQLGIGRSIITQISPRLVKHGLENKKVVKISAGNQHSAAVTKHGKLLTWGNGWYGKLGHGNSNDVFSS